MSRVPINKPLTHQLLQNILNPETRGGQVQPASIDTDAVMVFPAVQAQEMMNAPPRRTSVTGAAGVQTVRIPVDAGDYWYVVAWNAYHTDPVARNIVIATDVTPSTELVTVAYWAAIGPQERVPVQQVPRILFGGQEMVAFIPVAAGQQVVMSAYYYRFPLGHPFPLL